MGEAPSSFADKVQKTCKSCNYKFKVNLEMMAPQKCPWCGQEVDFEGNRVF